MPHIMISYQWDSQELAKKVFEKLERLGFDAWMDLEDMSGNINEAMAEGLFLLDGRRSIFQVFSSDLREIVPRNELFP